MGAVKLVLNKRPWGKLVLVDAPGQTSGHHTLLGALERVGESYWRWWPGRNEPLGGTTWPYGVWSYNEALWRLKRVAVALWGGGSP